MATALNKSGILAFAEAVFVVPDALVLEAYSEFDKEPRQFHSVVELVEFIQSCFLGRSRSAHFFVLYSEMRGRPQRKTIHLDQAKVKEGKIRYAWDGWGLISVFLQADEKQPLKSSVSSNSEVRANAWSSTYPEWPSPSTWDWQAISRHTKRLQRVLRKQLPNNSFEGDALKTTRGSS